MYEEFEWKNRYTPISMDIAVFAFKLFIRRQWMFCYHLKISLFTNYITIPQIMCFIIQCNHNAIIKHPDHLNEIHHWSKSQKNGHINPYDQTINNIIPANPNT